MANYDDTSYYTQIISNPDNKIVLSGGSGIISGFIDGETAFSTSASYSNELPDVLGGGATADAMNSAERAATSAGFGDITTTAVPPQKLTRIVWQSSAFNSISFDLYLPTTDLGQEKVMEMGKRVFDYTLPASAGGRLNYELVYAPNKYIINSNGGQTNLISVTIGNWFYAYNSFAAITGNLTVSKERIKGTNEPLYIKIALTLQPGKEFRAEEVKAWFR